MTEAIWITIIIGCTAIVASVCGVIAAALINKKNGHNKDIIALLKEELLDVLRELIKLNTANGETLKHIKTETEKVHRNTSEWRIKTGEMIKDVEMSHSRINDKLAVQNETLKAPHKRLDRK